MRTETKTAAPLTSREADVLQLLARGRTYIQVSDRLGMSVHTVESHVKYLYRKLEVHSARAAVWRAAELCLFTETSPIPPASEPTGRTT